MALKSKNKNTENGAHSSSDKTVRLPVRAAVVDKSGIKIGKIRRGVWYDGLDTYKGTFVKENGEVRLCVESVRVGYLDGNNNIFDNNGAYVASVRYIPWWLIVIPTVALAVIVALSALLAAVCVKQTENRDYAPVLFVCEADGTDWSETENLSVFANGVFGDKAIAPGMSGTYRFSLDSRNGAPSISPLLFPRRTHTV